jgi:hypothetical protein
MAGGEIKRITLKHSMIYLECKVYGPEMVKT